MGFKKVWGTHLRVKLRKTIVLVIGSNLDSFGAVLIVPPSFHNAIYYFGLVILFAGICLG